VTRSNVPSLAFMDSARCFTSPLILGVIFLVWGTPGRCLAEAPKVVKATPDDGDKGVDPKLTLLVVEFDQDMSPGMSLCGIADADVAGKPRWKSKRVFELPLKLKPNHKYEWSINCPSARNFKSAAGESAAIYPIRFKTAAPGAKPKAAPALSIEEKQQAIKELCKCIDESYAYRDLRRLDWDKIFVAHASRLEEATSWNKFAQACAQLLAAARDIHINVETADGDTIPTFRRDVRPNFKFAQVKAQVPEFKMHNRAVGSGKFDDGIGYILIGSWSSGKNGEIEPAFAALKEFSKSPGLVIDVRPNAGGSEDLAREFAGCFHQKPAVYSRNLIRDASQPNGFTKLFDRQVEPNAEKPAVSIPTMVLMGPANMSSCESFLLMMRAAPKVLLVGDRSYGSSGNPKPHEIGGGIKVLLPSWKDFMIDGTLLEGHGILPDISVPPGADDLDGTDPVLDVVLARLRK
jgi:hypothetical protein